MNPLGKNITAEIIEMEYSCSPGGVDCWDLVISGPYWSCVETGYKTVGDAMNKLLEIYPDIYNGRVLVSSLVGYNKYVNESETLSV